MDEMVDVVNERDEVLYSVAKREAHEKGLLHRTVIAEVRDEKGNFLLVKQAPDRQDAGQYVSPVGGHARTGETELDALKRETAEEIGLRDFKSRLVGKFIFNRFVKNRQENHYFIVYEIFADSALNLGPEAVSYRTFTKQELRRELSGNRGIFGAAYLAVVQKFYPELLQ